MAEYIEREAAEKISSKYGCDNGSALGIHSGLADCIAYEIAKIPAADVAPVVHGRWEKGPGYVCGDYQFFCSFCGEEFWESGYWPKRAKYCPNCGAKMDGGGDG